MLFIGNIIRGGQINSFSFFVVPLSPRGAECWDLSLYSDLEPNNNPTKVDSWVDWGNELWKYLRKREEGFHISSDN